MSFLTGVLKVFLQKDTPPEKIGAKSRYGLANFVQENLTKMARAFKAALYEEEEILQTAEEAMKYKHWREAMFT